MEAEANTQDSRPALLDTLTKLGTAAFDPHADPTAQKEARDAFENCIQRSPTVHLIPALNTLIQPGRAPDWLRSKFMTVLTLIPLRPDGVRATLEFVFSVHPSSTASLREMAQPQKQGANITQEALTMAARLLASPPSAETPDTWFAGIAPQLLQLLDGYDGLEMTKVASYVIGFGILGRKKFGAPGTAGWAAFASPLLDAISPTLQGKTLETAAGIIDLTRDAVLVSSSELSAALRRLQSLIISHPNPGLTRRLLSPVLLCLWSISSWPGAVGSLEEDYCLPARNMLKIYLRIDTSPANILRIISNLLYNGESDRDGLAWRFTTTKDDELETLRSRLGADQQHLDESTLAQVAHKSATLVELLESISADEDLSTMFLDLLRHWLQPSKTNAKNEILFRAGDSSETSSTDLLLRAKEGSVLQKMMEKYPEKLVKRPDQLLILVSEVLQQAEADGSVALALSLLNLVVTVPGFQRRNIKPDVLEAIESSLERIINSRDEEVGTTARNLSLLLKYRDELDDPAETTTAPTDRQIEDRKTYNLALSYITQSDSPPPVRSEGINLIQGLVQAGSPILDVPAVLVLMSSLLEENEDYINLRVIKVFTQLAHKHPKSTTSEILERYVDSHEKATVDTRLRFGEALVQVIERLGETFTGETAQQVGEALLFIAGRRSHRAKTAAKQAREAKLRELKKDRDEAVEDEEDEEITAEEKARQEILKSIVEGWQSKRGSEDVRIRASALSIFAVGIHTNIAGVGSHLVSAAIDLCLGILSMEKEVESGILRRSAIIVILEFVQALAAAKEAQKRIGFGLTDQSREDILRILRYVFDTDNDGLVRQHAADVIESLENWQMSQIMGQLEPSGPAISQLAGLAINPVTTISAEGNRPRIEEIE